MSVEKNDSLQEEHQRLLADSDQYLALIQKQKEHLAGVDMKIKEMKCRLLKKRRAMGGRTQTMRRSLHQIKHIRIMEDRLNQTTTKFDQLLYGNQMLRGDLEHLKRQRGSFANIYQRLSKELQLQHSTMEDLVEKSVLAYDQRSEALARMLAVRERSEKDTSLCHTEMTELRRVIDHELKLRNFMVRKSQETVPLGEDDEAKKRKMEQAKRERMGGESMETYQEVHRLIVSATEESNLLQVAETFTQEEERNFAYFNYISELNNKSTLLIECINKLRGNIVHIELERQQYDQQWQSQLKELEGELELHRSRGNDFQSQYIEVRKVLDQEKTAIADLFSNMSCDTSPITVQLGCSAQVTDDNVTQFIGILEERVYILLMVLVQSCYKEAEEMELLPQNPLLSSYSLLPCDPPSSTAPPSSSTLDDCSTDTLLGVGSELPLDFQTLRQCVLPRVVQTEQGTVPLAPSSASQKVKKKVGFNPKSA